MKLKLKSNFDELLLIARKYGSPEDLQFVNQIILSLTNFQVENTVENSDKIERILDLVITFYRQKLTNTSFSAFLLEIGLFASAHGYKNIAANVFRKIIVQHSKKPLVKSGDEIVAAAYLGLAELNISEGDWTNTKINIKKAKNIFSKQNNRMGLADTENFLGAVFAQRGEILKAYKQFEYALSFVKNTKKNLVKSKIQNNLGIVCSMTQKYSEAMKYYNSALNDFYELGDSKKIAETLHNIGMLQLKLENYEESLEKFKESNQIAILENIHPIVGISFLGLSEVFFKMGKISEAETAIEECLRYSYSINDRLTIADAFNIKAQIEENRGNLDAAETHLLTSLRINKEFKNQLNEAETAVLLGKLYSEMDKKDESKENLLMALRYYTKLDALKEIEDIVRQLNK